MNPRLWYPQLDLYDCIRRLALQLLVWKSSAPTIERILICDFFLANPPLLHNVRMNLESRKLFNSIKVVRPNKFFIEFPSPQLLYHKMEPIQNKAIQECIGKGIVETNTIHNGNIRLSKSGLKTAQILVADHNTEIESLVAEFLVTGFAALDKVDIHALRKSTGLRRVTQ